MNIISLLKSLNLNSFNLNLINLGPGAQKKRHRKLNPETEDTMSEDEESSGPPTPPSKSIGNSPRARGSGGQNSSGETSEKTTATTSPASNSVLII